MTVTATIEDPRTEVVLGGRVLESEGLAEYVWGHVSARDSEGRGIWIKAAGLGFREVAPRDVQLVGWDGDVLMGEGPRHAEFPIHTEVLRRRRDAGAVVHCHPAHVIALAAAGAPLYAFSHTGGIFARPVPRYDGARGLVPTALEGARMARALGDHRALILTGHGIVTAGASVGVAVMTAVMLERACRLQLLADDFGGVQEPLDEAQALAAYPHVQSDDHLLGAWRHLARLARQGTEFP
jgi:ribulose-5-phosphate 4-epimerase/fuculose-1-phosphate aldolase